MPATATLMTTADLLAMPDDGVERWLYKGEIREVGLSVRNRYHSAVMNRVGQVLTNWLDTRPRPRGVIVCGDAGFLLNHDPETTVGIDVAYVSPELAAKDSPETTVFDGVPIWAVEIISPSDQAGRLRDKLDIYRDVGVPVVWVVNPYNRAVTVTRAGQEPEMFNIRHDLVGDPELPGFRVAVAKLFE